MPMTANGIAKLIEEMGELTQLLGKKLAYFHTDEHPDGAGSLKSRMEDEMGDVLAAIAFVERRLGLNSIAIQDRSRKKLATFERWHADPENGSDAFHAPPPKQASEGDQYIGLTLEEMEQRFPS